MNWVMPIAPAHEPVIAIGSSLRDLAYRSVVSRLLAAYRRRFRTRFLFLLRDIAPSSLYLPPAAASRSAASMYARFATNTPATRKSPCALPKRDSAFIIDTRSATVTPYR